MITRAVLRYARISPRKFRQIIPIVKGRNAEEAVVVLRSVKKGASQYAIELIQSAISNAKRIQGVDTASLYISRFIADGGPQLKRFRAASMGRASPIRKRTSHITVELDAAAESSGEAATKKKAKAGHIRAGAAATKAPVVESPAKAQAKRRKPAAGKQAKE